MDVIVDGERNFELTGNPKDLLSVMGAIAEWLENAGRSMVKVCVNGESLMPDDLQRKAEAMPIDTITSLEVTSASTASLAGQTLAELEANLDELPAACRSLAEVFQGETPEQGYQHFEELAIIWQTVKKREIQVARALAVDLDGMLVDGVALPVLHEELNARLEEAADALQNGDCVSLGDLLEYELAPRAEQEAGIVALLREQLPESAG